MKTTFNMLIPQIPTYCGQEIVLPLYCKIPFQIFLFLTFLFVLSWEKKLVISCGSNVTVEDAPTPVSLLAWQRAILHPRAPSIALDQLTLWCCMVYWTHYGEYSLNKLSQYTCFLSFFLFVEKIPYGCLPKWASLNIFSYNLFMKC